ncbi:inositol 1,4,5-trisphosphate receptor-interacting protein-like 1 [Lissotriton helveticus]
MALLGLYFLVVLLHHMTGPPLFHDRAKPHTTARSEQQKLLRLRRHQLDQEFEWHCLEERWREQREQQQDVAWSDVKTQEVDWGCGLWNLGLFATFLLVELWWHQLQRDAMLNPGQSEEEDYDLDMVLPSTLLWPGCMPGQDALDALYERHIQHGVHDLASGCDFVEGFTDKLLEACRILCRKKGGLLLENGLGIGSTFEGWGRSKQATFDVLVPFQPPHGYTFRANTTPWQNAIDRCGMCEIILESQCPCTCGEAPCQLHPRGRVYHSRHGVPLDTLLCTDARLDTQKVHTWFQVLIDKAWGLISYKYDFKLMLVPANTCKLRLEYKSSRVLHINLIPAVRCGDSCIFLVRQVSEGVDTSGIYWMKSFAVYERQFLRLMRRFLPENSCHLKCLSILAHLKEEKGMSDKAILTSYHFKTALMHLLTRRSLDAWRADRISQRTQDVMRFLRRGLSEKHLYHFIIGNPSLPREISVPGEYRSKEAQNLLRPLVLEHKAYGQAEHEYEGMVCALTSLTSQTSDATVPMTSQCHDLAALLTSQCTELPPPLTFQGPDIPVAPASQCSELTVPPPSQSPEPTESETSQCLDLPTSQMFTTLDVTVHLPQTASDFPIA